MSASATQRLAQLQQQLGHYQGQQQALLHDVQAVVQQTLQARREMGGREATEFCFVRGGALRNTQQLITRSRVGTILAHTPTTADRAAAGRLRGRRRRRPRRRPNHGALAADRDARVR